MVFSILIQEIYLVSVRPEVSKGMNVSTLRYIRYGSIPHHERMYPVLSLSKHQGERLLCNPILPRCSAPPLRQPLSRPLPPKVSRPHSLRLHRPDTGPWC